VTVAHAILGASPGGELKIDLTRRKGQTYEEHIQEIAGNALATEVKIADNLTNLSDSPTDRQIEKYAKSLLVLVEARKKHLR